MTSPAAANVALCNHFPYANYSLYFTSTFLWYMIAQSTPISVSESCHLFFHLDLMQIPFCCLVLNMGTNIKMESHHILILILTAKKNRYQQFYQVPQICLSAGLQLLRQSIWKLLEFGRQMSHHELLKALKDIALPWLTPFPNHLEAEDIRLRLGQL